MIGTPGRLLQLMELKILSTQSLKMIVFDEADEMVNNESMQNTLKQMFTHTPKDV